MRPIPLIRFGMQVNGSLPADHAIDHARVLQSFRERLLLVGEYIRSVWAARAQQLQISDSGDYIRGITTDARIETTFRETETAIHATVEITNTSRHAVIVEDGHSAFHLPSRIRWFDPTLRVKRGKTGNPYLHIPFRHYTTPKPGSGPTNTATRHQMPEEVYQRAKRLARVVPMRRGPIYGASGFTDPQGRRHAGQMFQQADMYSVSGRGRRRLTHGKGTPTITVGPNGVAMQAQRGRRGVAGARGASNPPWQSSKYEGLMKTGPARHTRYLTVRTITPDSVGWWIPARHGTGVRRQVLMVLRHGEGARRLRELLRSAVVQEIR